MLLVSQAVDYAIAKIDFTPLTGQQVYLDTTALGSEVIDKGYLYQHRAAANARATACCFKKNGEGGLHRRVARHAPSAPTGIAVMIGTPAVTLPGVVPGPPITSIPEIALAKKSDQRGRREGRRLCLQPDHRARVWQSGTVESNSQLKDTWVFGAGPFTRGTIRQRTELAGEPLPTLSSLANPAELFAPKGEHQPAGSTATERFFPNNAVPPPPLPLPAAVPGVTGGPIIADKQLLQRNCRMRRLSPRHRDLVGGKSVNPGHDYSDSENAARNSPRRPCFASSRSGYCKLQ